MLLGSGATYECHLRYVDELAILISVRIMLCVVNCEQSLTDTRIIRKSSILNPEAAHRYHTRAMIKPEPTTVNAIASNMRLGILYSRNMLIIVIRESENNMQSK
jgi:hypothetical protein